MGTRGSTVAPAAALVVPVGTWGYAPIMAIMTRRGLLELGAGLALAIGALALAAGWGSSRAGARGSGVRPFEVTRPVALAPAPDFELTDLAGRPARLQDLRGRVVFLNVWATWCVPCREEIPAMEILSRDLAPRGLTVLAVNHKEDPTLVGRFTREYGVTFRVLLDPEGEVAARYRLVGLPGTYFIDRSGLLVGSVLGLRDWSSPEARRYLDQLLAARS